MYQKSRNKISILTLFFALSAISGAILISPLPVFSATYYVSPTGDDSNPGTEPNPWKTIQKAANTVVAGDTVVVKEGTYEERVLLPSQKSGTSEAKIIFKAEPARSVYMRGFRGDRNNYIRIEGFNITHNAGGWLGGGIWLDGNNWEIVNNYFYDIPGTAISPTWQGGRTTNNIYLANNYIYKCNKGFGVGGNSWLVENNEVERLYRFDVMEGSPYGEDADYSRFFGENHIIRNNFFYGTKHEEIGSSHTDCFQTFPNNGNIAKNIIIENNICFGFFSQGIMAEGELREGGPSHDNIIVRNNIFTGGGAWGISAHGISNLKVYNNVFADIGIHGIGFRVSRSGITPIGTTGIIKNNIFYNAGSNYWKDDSSIYEVSNNLLYKTSGTIDHSRYPNDIVNQDPQFLDPANKDYRLKSTSPAIDAGASLAGIVDKDIIDTSRPQGCCWDIGAYEYILPDTTPDAFTFEDQEDVPLNSVIISNTILVSGINVATPILISSCTSGSCEYRINSERWQSEEGRVEEGDTVTVRQTSSSEYFTETVLTLEIGGVRDSFSVTTVRGYRLIVSKSGIDGGMVMSEPAGIECGEDCEERYAYNTEVVLRVEVDEGFEFIGWGGDCDKDGKVVMDGDKWCNAEFRKEDMIDGGIEDGGDVREVDVGGNRGGDVEEGGGAVDGGIIWDIDGGEVSVESGEVSGGCSCSMID